MLEKKRVNTGALLGLFGAVAALALVILLENTIGPTGQLFTVLKKGAVYALVAVSMNLLNGFTGLFSLGQAGFMLLGAYTYAILTVPMSAKDTVYYLYGGSAVKFSLPDLFAGIFGEGMLSLTLGVLVAIILGGLVAAFFAWLIGLPVLRLKSDYLAIATLGFAEIIRAVFQWQALGPITNGSNLLKGYPDFGHAWAYLILIAIFIGIILGLAVGAVPLHLPGISAPVRLGLAGGPIIVGILIGTFGPRLHMITYTTLSANLMLRGIGLSMYLACLGLDAGAHFFDTVMRPEGAMWIGLGFALTLLPVLVMGWIALRWSRLDFGSTCGMLCGAMANPMALGYANDTIEGDNPSVSYATVYPLSMFVRVILAQVVLLFFR